MKKMRLIDVDALIEVLSRNNIDNIVTVYDKTIMEHIKDAPTIEAEPVRHGEWKEVGVNICCTACGAMFKDEICHMNVDYGYRIPQRCQECGASMAVEAEKT